MKKATIKINYETQEIIVSREFHKLALIFGTSEYKALKAARKAEPGFTVKAKEIAKNRNKKTYSNLTFKNMKKYMTENEIPSAKLPNFSVAAAIALIGAFLSKDFFYQKALNFLNSTDFGSKDQIFSQDIGYYIFQRPFLMSIYNFISSLWLFVIVYTVAYYIVVFFLMYNNVTIETLKVKTILRHNIINIAIFFFIKAFSYKFQKEGILYSTFLNVNANGASYIDVNVWLKYYLVAPILLVLIVLTAFFFIWKWKLKQAAYTIAVFPAVWLLATIISMAVQGFIVKPNEFNYESKYLSYNMEKTREAYSLNDIKNIKFPDVEILTPEIINRNLETKNNIRIVDYQSTLDTNVQLQSNTLFYNFHNGDIINYTVNEKEIPIFITAREIDKNKLLDKSYINTTFKYTHGYGVVMNPINKLTPQGQAEFILSGLKMKSSDENISVVEPRIYYGELTRDHVIVNASNDLNEIDYDGTTETRYAGKGGINLNSVNRLLFSIKYSDFNMLVSGYVSGDSKLLLNREVVGRAQRAVPFLSVDPDPYIIIGDDGRLKWILDAYTTTADYPYSQTQWGYNSFNYIRNSVKIVRIKDAIHGFISNPLSQHTEECYDIINEFLINDL